MNVIRFYRANEKPYGAFSNLFRRSVTFDGETFPTSEHAYQAGKPRRPEVRKWLVAAPSPALLAMAAHGLYQWDIIPNWSKTKFDRMRSVLWAKFTQHSDLAELLLLTGDALLIETATVDNPVNRLWGEVNGVGKNLLGQMLMEVRERLRTDTSLLGNCSGKINSPGKDQRTARARGEDRPVRHQASGVRKQLPRQEKHREHRQTRN
jgi:ribA/ribD-fused uncharacterized protein